MRRTDPHSTSTAARPAEPLRLVAWGAAALATVAAGAAMLAAPGNAAPTVMTWNLHAKSELDPGTNWRPISSSRYSSSSRARRSFREMAFQASMLTSWLLAVTSHLPV